VATPLMFLSTSYQVPTLAAVQTVPTLLGALSPGRATERTTADPRRLCKLLHRLHFPTPPDLGRRTGERRGHFAPSSRHGQAGSKLPHLARSQCRSAVRPDVPGNLPA